MSKITSQGLSKLPHVGTTIFTVMSKLATDNGAINLGQGFPEFDCSQLLRDLVTKYMNKGLNQYPPMAGVPRLREVISQKMSSLYGASYDPDDEVTVVPGATNGLFSAIAAFVRPGDEVIIFEPAYDSYAPAVVVNGGIPVFVQLRFPNFHIDWKEVKGAITAKTRMIIINSPQNPTGSVLSKADMLVLASVLRDTQIIVLSDEVYEHIIFDDQQHESVSRYPELSERSVVVFSFGKTYHVTGWKMGYVLAPRDLMIEFRKVHQFNTFAANSPIQHAFAEHMQDTDAYLSLSEFYQRKRDLFLEGIESSRFKALPSKGTYFQTVSYDDITDENDLEFSVRLTKDFKVASIPMSAFYQTPPKQRMLRFCFAKSEDTLVRGAEILSRI